MPGWGHVGPGCEDLVAALQSDIPPNPVPTVGAYAADHAEIGFAAGRNPSRDWGVLVGTVATACRATPVACRAAAAAAVVMLA